MSDIDETIKSTVRKTRVPVFESVAAPRLLGLSKKQLIKFKKAYQDYLLKIGRLMGEEGASAEDSQVKPLPVTVCVESNLLRAIAQLGDWGEKVDADGSSSDPIVLEAENMTDQLVWKWIDAEIGAEHHLGDHIVDMSTLVKANLKFDTKIRDSRARCLKLFSDWYALVEEFNLSPRLSGSNRKKKADLIVSVLTPPAFKTMVQDEIDNYYRHDRGDERVIFKVINSLCVQFDAVTVRVGAANASSGANPSSGRGAKAKSGSEGSVSTSIRKSDSGASTSAEPKKRSAIGTSDVASCSVVGSVKGITPFGAVQNWSKENSTKSWRIGSELLVRTEVVRSESVLLPPEKSRL